MLKRGMLVCALALTSLTGAPVASAQDPDVQVDPDSPSGVEYAIPLEEARRKADPKPSSGAPAAQATPEAVPFGEGVTTPEAPAEEPDQADRASASGDRERRKNASDRRRKARAAAQERKEARERRASPAVIAAAAKPAGPVSGAGSLLTYGGAGLLVLAVGVAAGVMLRRRSQS